MRIERPCRGDEVLVKTFNTKLVVTAPEAGQREVLNLLMMLREGEDDHRPAAGGMRTTPSVKREAGAR